jgi:putative ABC transport system permease protein
MAVPVKAQALEAARGATDFGEYFLYFSFFLVMAALLLAGLFFQLGIEQRSREIGVLRALGFPMAKIRGCFCWREQCFQSPAAGWESPLPSLTAG